MSLVFSAPGAIACDVTPDDPIESRSVPGGDDDGGDDGDDDGCYDDGEDEGGDEGGDYGCTRTQGYWKNHNTSAKNYSQQLEWPIDEGTSLCGKTWLTILKTAPMGDPWYIAAHQWIAARLNIASGASTTSDVETAISFLTSELADCDVDDATTALEYSELLDDYNNGKIGPGHCGETQRFAH